VLLGTSWCQTLIIQLLYVAVIDNGNYYVLSSRMALLIALPIAFIVNVA